MSMKNALLAVWVICLVGCSSLPTNPLPADYQGPAAWIADSGSYESDGKAQVFVVVEVDGVSIDNAVLASRRASSGRGFSLTAQYIDRRVPVRQLSLKIRGTHITAAPIHEMASRAAGTFHFVEGTVSLSPRESKNYVVRGRLEKEGSAVWIEDADTNEVVTQKVTTSN